MTALLRVAGLRKAFGGLVAVDGVGFDLAEGDILGLIGPNGSGKTTTLNLISGELRADEGSIRLDGREVAGLPAFRRNRGRIARTFQLVRVLPQLSVRDNVRVGCLFGAEPRPAPVAARDAEALLGFVGLAARADASAGQLTYIDQKRLELARALATRPRLLLLDEWLSGLNPSELQDGIALVRRTAERVAGIILVEHVMTAIRALCNTLVVMNAGTRIAEGAPEAVLRDAQVVRAYLGSDDA